MEIEKYFAGAEISSSTDFSNPKPKHDFVSFLPDFKKNMFFNRLKKKRLLRKIKHHDLELSCSNCKNMRLLSAKKSLLHNHCEKDLGDQSRELSGRIGAKPLKF